MQTYTQTDKLLRVDTEAQPLVKFISFSYQGKMAAPILAPKSVSNCQRHCCVVAVRVYSPAMPNIYYTTTHTITNPSLNLKVKPSLL